MEWKTDIVEDNGNKFRFTRLVEDQPLNRCIDKWETKHLEHPDIINYEHLMQFRDLTEEENKQYQKLK